MVGSRFLICGRGVALFLFLESHYEIVCAKSPAVFSENSNENHSVKATYIAVSQSFSQELS